MAIDRGPWNALVDDDGSNLVGSIWNKAAIKSVILDPTDAALAALAGPWVSVPFAAGNFSADAGGSWTVTAGQLIQQAYMITNQAIDLMVAINGSTVGGTTANLTIGGWPVSIGGPSVLGISSLAGPGWGPVQVRANLSPSIAISRLDFGNFPAGTANKYFYLSARYQIL